MCVGWCVLLVACCCSCVLRGWSLCAVCCMLFGSACLCVACCMLFVACRVVCVDRCVSSVDRAVLIVGCWLLCVDY